MLNKRDYVGRVQIGSNKVGLDRLGPMGQIGSSPTLDDNFRMAEMSLESAQKLKKYGLWPKIGPTSVQRGICADSLFDG